MGSALYKSLFPNDNAKWLYNIGSEEIKGTDTLKRLIKIIYLFNGYIEK